jgi:hypothetical protein
MSDPTGTSKLKWKIFVPPAVVTVNDDLSPGETPPLVCDVRAGELPSSSRIGTGYGASS